MIYRRAILFLILLSSILEAGVQQYLKRLDDKTGSHQMPEVDFIYLINLDERPEKLHSSVSQLHPFDIYPCRFSAINGWKLPLMAFDDLGVRFESWMTPNIWGTCYFLENNGDPHHEIIRVIGRTYFCHCMSRGAVAIALSHLSVLQDAYDAGYETIWVMEDDIHVVRDPRILSALIRKLDATAGKTEWDVLFTDPDTKNRKGAYVPCSGYAPRPNFTPSNPGRFAARSKVGSDFERIGARYGAYSMILRRSGIKKILNFMKQYGIFLPYDMEYFVPNDIKLYSLSYDVVSTCPEALSDNAGPNYEKNGVAGKDVF